MKLVYISEGNIPSRSANSIQVVKMSQAFSMLVDDFELITLGDLCSFILNDNLNINKCYGLSTEFNISRLPLLLRGSYPFSKNYRHKLFPRLAVHYSKFKSPDVIYTRSLIAASHAINLGMKVILEYHNSIHNSFIDSGIFSKKEFLGLVTIADELADTYAANGINKEKIYVEQDGVDVNSFLPHQSVAEARLKLQISNSIPLVGYAGHLYDFKGLPTLYKTASLLPNVLFIIAGGWEEDINSARDYCMREGINNIRFEGYIPQGKLATYLYACNILVLPTSAQHIWANTTSPLKLFEYMSVSRPIVASNLSNISKILSTEKNAILFNPDSPCSLKEAILRLIKEPYLCNRIAKQAFQDVQYYDWRKRAERILNYYELFSHYKD